MLNNDSANFELNNAANLKWIAWMSFFWSVSTLMVFSILPAFLVDELKMGHSNIGYLEGVAISSSFLSKFFSGYLSDVYRGRKPLIMLGTLLSALTKPMFAICQSAGLMFGLRFTDRLSKGIRSAPTDALIADLSESNLYASNFGMRQSLYTFGDVVGAALAMIIMLLSNNNYRLVFALSFIPAAAAIVVLWFLVRPHPCTHPRINSQFQFKEMRLADLKRFSPTFWWLMFALFFLMLARFSEAFLTLKAKDVGWATSLLPALFIVLNLVHAGIAWPAGKYADQFSRVQMLVAGLGIMIAAQLMLSYVSSVPGVLAGVICLGIHLGITQGLLKAVIAQSTPPELRGLAFSLFFVISGFALFLGNSIAGNLSQQFGLYATFLAGGGFTATSMLILHFTLARQKIKQTEAVA